MPYIPHTDDDVNAMLTSIGAPTVDALFDEIPEALRSDTLTHIPSGLCEMDLLQHARSLAEHNQNGTCFLGAGCYEHHIPAAVWDIASRGEFLTAYTPYQAEASQGTLQLLYEYQTMIAELTQMDVANASMYDGATALAEAVLMAARLKKKHITHRVLVTGALHPFYRETLETMVRNVHIELITLPFDAITGTIKPTTLAPYTGQEITALVIAQPNFFGCLEQVDVLTDWAHANGVMSIACVNPVALALLKPPGDWGQHGVDIACGEGQPLGSPLASGGPYFGFFSTRMEHVRQMPGRLIGRTKDVDGNDGFTLTLQAREQHIRRAKATSNICTNQGLLVTAATIHMSLLGAEGLRQVAMTCHSNTHALMHELTAIPGITPVFSSPFFHEVLLRLDKPVDDILRILRKHGILGGWSVGSYFSGLDNSLLVCVTEMRTQEDIKFYAHTLRQIMEGTLC